MSDETGHTLEEVSDLADAMCMVLNELAEGNTVCDLVKAHARLAMEPFLLDDNGNLPELVWARAVIIQSDATHAEIEPEDTAQ